MGWNATLYYEEPTENGARLVKQEEPDRWSNLHSALGFEIGDPEIPNCSTWSVPIKAHSHEVDAAIDKAWDNDGIGAQICSAESLRAGAETITPSMFSSESAERWRILEAEHLRKKLLEIADTIPPNGWVVVVFS